MNFSEFLNESSELKCFKNPYFDANHAIGTKISKLSVFFVERGK